MTPTPEVVEAVEALKDLIHRIETWEAAVRKVITVPLNHGMDLTRARAALAEYLKQTGAGK